MKQHLKEELWQEQQKHHQIIQNIQSKLIFENQPIHGTDDDVDNEHEFESMEEMWRSLGILVLPSDDVDDKKYNNNSNDGQNNPNKTKGELNDEESSQDSWYWYDQASDHYDHQPATLQGMLGGFADLSKHDLISSRTFLTHLQQTVKPQLKFESICDCGAGIGRITRGLFMKLPGFTSCDLIEGSSIFLKRAEIYLNENNENESTNRNVTIVKDSNEENETGYKATSNSPKCRLIHKGLQNFYPQTNFYDVVWIQWVIGYLTDYDCVRFFQRCGATLKENGILCLKDNMIASSSTNYSSNSKAFVFDSEDSSVTRSKAYLEAIIEEAGCWTKIYEKQQEGFPEEIFPVWMMAYEIKQ